MPHITHVHDTLRVPATEGLYVSRPTDIEEFTSILQNAKQIENHICDPNTIKAITDITGIKLSKNEEQSIIKDRATLLLAIPKTTPNKSESAVNVFSFRVIEFEEVAPFIY